MREAMEFQFQHRTGRFASTLMVVLFNPLIYSGWLTGIKLYPVFFLILFIGTFHFFLYRSLNRQVRSIHLFPFSLVLVVCFILELESVVEVFYWFAANCVYGMPMLLFLVNLALLLKLLPNPGFQNRYQVMAGICFLGMVLCGFNELALINIVSLNFLVLVYLIYSGNRRLTLAFGICFLFIAGAAFISLSAPGNWARAKTLNSDLPAMVSVPYLGGLLLTGAKYLLLKSKNWIFGLPLISASALLAFITWKYQLKTTLRFKNFKQVFIYILVVYGMLLLQLFPVLYTSGLSGLVDRAANVLWFHFFIYWVLGLILFVPFLREECKISFIVPPKIQTRFFHGILAAFLAAVLSSFHILQAYQDLFFKAPGYDAGLNKRYAVLRQAKIKNQMTIEVLPIFPQLRDYPGSIFKLELSHDPATYFNSSVATYFGLHSVKLAAPPKQQAQ
jgi:hypothetical protein